MCCELSIAYGIGKLLLHYIFWVTDSHTHASTPAHTCLHYCYNILFRTSPLRLLLPPLGRSACSHLVQFPTTFGRLKFNSPSRLQKQFACATLCACVCVCVQLILMANLTLIAKCLTRAALQLNETATFEGAREGGSLLHFGVPHYVYCNCLWQ